MNFASEVRIGSKGRDGYVVNGSKRWSFHSLYPLLMTRLKLRWYVVEGKGASIGPKFSSFSPLVSTKTRPEVASKNFIGLLVLNRLRDCSSRALAEGIWRRDCLTSANTVLIIAFIEERCLSRNSCPLRRRSMRSESEYDLKRKCNSVIRAIGSRMAANRQSITSSNGSRR